MAADVIMDMVMVVDVVEDGRVLFSMAHCLDLVAVGQTVVTALLGCLVARWWERLWLATCQAQGCAVMQRPALLSTDAHICTLLVI